MADLQLEKLSTGGWVWTHQTPGGGFYRAPRSYRTKTAAEKAGREWLTRRANPRTRGR